MKVSEKWLDEFVDKELSTNNKSELFTMAGLEVDAVEPCAIDVSGVVIGKVVSCERISGTEKLSLCEVEDGSTDIKQVVCGAENVSAGQLYPYAKPGSVLKNGQKIEKREIHGVESEGMLCSAFELGLVDASTGLYEVDADASPGEAFINYLSLEDNVFDISLTPNRGDCLSVIGLTRELSVLTDSNHFLPTVQKVPSKIQDKLDIYLQHPESCPRYCGRIIKGINSSVITPTWIKERLRRSGVRAINIIVDLTNYVMLEMGQPMHAFDLQKLDGNITVRMAKKQEQLILLDGENYKLEQNTLVISDKTGAIAMAGIMGGETTAVTTGTTDIFLESAFFTPTAIMGRARQYGLHTDASHRFERGVDPELAERALERLSSLLLKYCDGAPGPIVNAQAMKDLPDQKNVLLHHAKVNSLLGSEIESTTSSAILKKLGFELEELKDGWKVTVPSYRFDIEQEVDLIEEIARVYGYHHIPETLPTVSINLQKRHQRTQLYSLLVNRLVSIGYTEVITYSFVDADLQNLLGFDGESLTLMNPISTDMSVMRQTLLPGLLKALQFNIKRQQNRLKIFEFGRCFDIEQGAIKETDKISGLTYGNMYEKQWGMEDISSDYYSIKSDLGAVLSQFLDPVDLIYKNSDIKALHPYQNAEIYYKNQNIGYIGTIDPGIQADLDIAETIHVFEIDIPQITAKTPSKYMKISKYPSIRRDISVIVDEKLPAIEVINSIKNTSYELLDNLELFDVYQGEGIDIGKKSLALGLTFRRSSSTLTDEEADIVINDVVSSLNNQFGAILRE